MDIIDWVLGVAESVPPPVTWLLAGVFALLESGLGLGFVVPGETIVLLLAATMPSPLAALGMLAAVVVGASAGDHVGYLIGRRLGPRLRETRLVRRLGQQHWDRAVDVLERRGAWAVFLTRLVPVVRTLTPAAAGTAQLAYHRFLAASLAGATTWSLLYVGVGYALRGALEVAEEVLGDAVLVLLVVAAAVVLVTIVARAVLRREPVQAWLADADADVGWRTLPNAISVARVLLAVVVALLLAHAQWAPAAVVVALSWATDAVDGLVARARATVSTLGRALDPIADHLLVLGIVIGMAVGQVLSIQIVVVLVVIDVFCAVLATIRSDELRTLRPTRLGQVRTLVQLGGLLAMVVGLATQGASPLAYGILVGLGFLVLLAGLVLHVLAAARLAARLAVAAR